jgi:hypothetical protein
MWGETANGGAVTGEETKARAENREAMACENPATRNL